MPPDSSLPTLPFGDVYQAPSVAAVLCLIMLLYGVLAAKRRFATKLITHRGIAILFILASAVVAFCGSVILDEIGFGNMLNNRFHKHFPLSGTLLVICGSWTIWAIFITAYKDFQTLTSLQEAELHDRVIQSFRKRSGEIAKIVAAKALRVKKQAVSVAEKGKETTTSKLRKAFEPQHQMNLALASLYLCLREQIKPEFKLRIAVFLPAADGTRMEVFMSFDGENAECVTSPADGHAEEFIIAKGPNAGCLVVHTALVGGQHVISNTENMSVEDSKKFAFFDTLQRTRIKSIAAFAYEVDDKRPFPVVVADSDMPGAFPCNNEKERKTPLEKEQQTAYEILKTNFREFSSRLLYEFHVLKLLDRGDKHVKKHVKSYPADQEGNGRDTGNPEAGGSGNPRR
jgi:uncharacterized protein (UPF0333 family)